MRSSGAINVFAYTVRDIHEKGRGVSTAQPAIPPARVLRRKYPLDRFLSRNFASGGVVFDRARTFWLPHDDADAFCSSCVWVIRLREVNLVPPRLKSFEWKIHDESSRLKSSLFRLRDPGFNLMIM